MSTLKSTLKSWPPLTIPQSYQPILGPSDLSRPLKSQEKSLLWVGGGWKPKIGYSSGPNLTLLTLTWPSPDLDLDLSLTINISGLTSQWGFIRVGDTGKYLTLTFRHTLSIVSHLSHHRITLFFWHSVQFLSIDFSFYVLALDGSIGIIDATAMIWGWDQ